MTETNNEIDRHISKTKLAVDNLRKVNSAAELRDKWEDFLHGFHRSIGRMISVAIKNKSSRSWGHRLKNASTKDDPGLVFLREARAQAEHGLEPFAVFKDPMVDLAGVIAMAGTSKISFRNSSINGVPTGEFSISTENGVVDRIEGTPNIEIAQNLASVELQPIRSEQKTTVVSVPTAILDHSISDGKPISLAETSVRVLAQLRSELEQFFRSTRARARALSLSAQGSCPTPRAALHLSWRVQTKLAHQSYETSQFRARPGGRGRARTGSASDPGNLERPAPDRGWAL